MRQENTKNLWQKNGEVACETDVPLAGLRQPLAHGDELVLAVCLVAHLDMDETHMLWGEDEVFHAIHGGRCCRGAPLLLNAGGILGEK